MSTTTDPALHCFREDSPTEACRDCNANAEQHTGCDCECAGYFHDWQEDGSCSSCSKVLEYADDEYRGRIPGR